MQNIKVSYVKLVIFFLFLQCFFLDFGILNVPKEYKKVFFLFSKINLLLNKKKFKCQKVTNKNKSINR